MITNRINERIAETTNLDLVKVKNAVKLFKDGNTLPFIARYRKEAIGFLNEIDLRKIEDKLLYFENLYQRKDEIVEILKKNGQLNDKLLSDILNAETNQVLEDIYLPFKKRKKTKADLAREKGLTEVAEFLLKSRIKNDKYFDKFINSELFSRKQVVTEALFIVAEEIANNLKVRELLRDFIINRGSIVSKKKKKDDERFIYSSYYDYSQPIKYIPEYRVLALLRGEKEKILNLKIELPFQPLNKIAYIMKIHKSLPYYEELISAVEDSYKRLLFSSVSNSVFSNLQEKAQDKAIKIFAKNVRDILFTPPLANKRILGIDPGFRSGCKIIALDENGDFIKGTTIFPNPPKNDFGNSSEILASYLSKYSIDLIAIGNGTASKETRDFVIKTCEKFKMEIKHIIVSEAGASVYSASKIAIDEFLQLDLTMRSAISIARRVLSPIDELVKIPPQSIGVGMYQHDLDKKKLEKELVREVTSVVNEIGVDINKVSPYLLQYVSGLNLSKAKKIVEYRKKHYFQNRMELLNVPGIGEKTFQLCAGFCRINRGNEFLDSTIIHPEMYNDVYKLFFRNQEKLSQETNFRQFFNSLKIENIRDLFSTETLKFIENALLNKNFDPREKYPQPKTYFRTKSLDSIKENDILEGTIKNITDFGLFVDLGLKIDGLVYKNEYTINDAFYSGQIIKVRIKKIDTEKGRLSLGLNYQKS